MFQIVNWIRYCSDLPTLLHFLPLRSVQHVPPISVTTMAYPVVLHIWNQGLLRILCWFDWKEKISNVKLLVTTINCTSFLFVRWEQYKKMHSYSLFNCMASGFDFLWQIVTLLKWPCIGWIKSHSFWFDRNMLTIWINGLVLKDVSDCVDHEGSKCSHTQIINKLNLYIRWYKVNHKTSRGIRN